MLPSVVGSPTLPQTMTSQQQPPEEGPLLVEITPKIASDILVILGLHPSVLLLPAVIGRLGDLDGAANVSDGFALGDQLLSGFELADDLLGCVADSFHGEVPGPVWPDEDSHSPWTGFWGPRHLVLAAMTRSFR